MELNLYNLILEYQKNNNPKNLEELTTYFLEDVVKIANKLKYAGNYEYAETDIVIALIELLKKIDLEKYKDNKAIKFFIINSLANKRIDIFRKEVKGQEETLELKLDVIFTKVDNDYSELIINDLIREFKPREKEIIQLAFFEGYSNIEISKKFNLTEQRIGQLKNKLLGSLRKSINI